MREMEDEDKRWEKERVGIRGGGRGGLRIIMGSEKQ
jgi:hypothetical protein